MLLGASAVAWISEKKPTLGFAAIAIAAASVDFVDVLIVTPLTPLLLSIALVAGSLRSQYFHRSVVVTFLMGGLLVGMVIVWMQLCRFVFSSKSFDEFVGVLLYFRDVNYVGTDQYAVFGATWLSNFFVLFPLHNHIAIVSLLLVPLFVRQNLSFRWQELAALASASFAVQIWFFIFRSHAMAHVGIVSYKIMGFSFLLTILFASAAMRAWYDHCFQSRTRPSVYE